jgi:hypothetical protein
MFTIFLISATVILSIITLSSEKGDRLPTKKTIYWFFHCYDAIIFEYVNLHDKINSWNLYRFFYTHLSHIETFQSLKNKNNTSKDILQNSLGNYFLAQKKNDKSEVAQFTSWSYEDILKRGNEILSFLSKYFEINLGTEAERTRLLMSYVKP